MPKDKRLDLLVVEVGLISTRQLARAAIMSGNIFVNGVKSTKPGTLVSSSSKIEVSSKWQQTKYASRGGLKLEKALEVFMIKPEGLVCLDIGASKGGFTDCLLKHGAALVYAVDVGYGQLDWSLRNHPQVFTRERVNARFLKPKLLYNKDDTWASLAVIDVSFISVLKILPACLSVLVPKPEIICLIKPQFEAGYKEVSLGSGVIKKKDIHIQVLKSISEQAAEIGLITYNLTYSPLTGPAGNIEFLVHWRKSDQDLGGLQVDIEAVVLTAHNQFY